MAKSQLPIHGNKTFEELKLTNEHGAEYWSARDLQPLLGYTQWRRFEQAIERAISSCETSGNKPAHHFAGAGKMVDLGSGGQRDGYMDSAIVHRIGERSHTKCMVNIDRSLFQNGERPSAKAS